MRKETIEVSQERDYTKGMKKKKNYIISPEKFILPAWVRPSQDIFDELAKQYELREQAKQKKEQGILSGKEKMEIDNKVYCKINRLRRELEQYKLFPRY